jgi:hypothetical protein
MTFETLTNKVMKCRSHYGAVPTAVGVTSDNRCSRLIRDGVGGLAQAREYSED